MKKGFKLWYLAADNIDTGRKKVLMMMDYVESFEPAGFCIKTLRNIFIISYVTVVTPILYNIGSAEIGCPVYEFRTGQECKDILNP